MLCKEPWTLLKQVLDTDALSGMNPKVPWIAIQFDSVLFCMMFCCAMLFIFQALRRGSLGCAFLCCILCKWLILESCSIRLQSLCSSVFHSTHSSIFVPIAALWSLFKCFMKPHFSTMALVEVCRIRAAELKILRILWICGAIEEAPVLFSEEVWLLLLQQQLSQVFHSTRAQDWCSVSNTFLSNTFLWKMVMSGVF